MNERIKELIKSLGIIPEDEHYEVAELIVRECANAVENSVWHLPRGYKAKDQAEFVKKHFGVE